MKRRFFYALALFGLAAAPMVQGAGAVLTPLFTFQPLVESNPTNPSQSQLTNADGSSVQGTLLYSGGMLYGTADQGGTNGFGTVYSIDANGNNFTLLHTFSIGPTNSPYSNYDGQGPRCQLALDGSTLYGATAGGGSNLGGTIFSVNTDGTGFTTLASMYDWDPAFPSGPIDLNTVLGPVVVAGGTVYAAAFLGGTNGNGGILSVGTNGSNYTRLYDLGMGSNGSTPRAGLILGGTNLYGTCQGGGSNNSGVVFAAATNGSSYVVLHDFSAVGTVDETNADGAGPISTLALSGNTLYGCCVQGGPNGAGTIFSVGTDGSGFTVLHTFPATVNGLKGSYPLGREPQGPITIVGDTLYGVTTAGGDLNEANGVAWSMKTDGSDYTAIYTLTGDYQSVQGAIYANGAFYGVSSDDGTQHTGVIYTIAGGAVKKSPPGKSVLNIVINGSGLADPNLDGQNLTIGGKYSVNGVGTHGYILSNWVASGGASFTSNRAMLSFTMVSNLTLTANFVTNPFLPITGVYDGLFGPATNADRAQLNSGAAIFALVKSGGFGGTLFLGSTNYHFSGFFDVTGAATVEAKGPGKAAPLTLALQLNFTNHTFTGTVSGAAFSSPISGARDDFSGAHHATGFSGSYMVSLPAATNAAVGPTTASTLKLTVGVTGNLTLTGKLADGNSVIESAFVASTGLFPVYLDEDRGLGSIWGWGLISNGAVTSPSGLSWINEGASFEKQYSTGFTNPAVALTNAP